MSISHPHEWIAKMCIALKEMLDIVQIKSNSRYCAYKIRCKMQLH